MWLTTVLCDKRPCEQQHWLMWSSLCAALFSVSWHTVSNNICLNTPTGSVDHRWHSCTSIWVNTLRFLPLSCPKFSDRKCFTQFDFEQSAQTQIVHLFFFFHSHCTRGLLLSVSTFLKVSAVREQMMSRENYAANKAKAAWRWNTQQAAQRDLLTLTTESCAPLRCILRGSGWCGSGFGALCKATAL